MKRFKAEGYTNEDFLKAKRVCDGTDTDLAFFTECYRNLVVFISEKYSIREDPSEDPYNYEAKVEIPRKFKIMMYVDKVMTELSIGEFILKSLQDWNPETTSYLTFLYQQLIIWNARVPVKRTETQQIHMYQFKTLIDVVKSIKPELNMKDLPFDEILKMMGQYLPKEYRGKLLDILPIFQAESSLDVSLSEDTNSDTFLDMLESTYSVDDEIAESKKDPYSIVEKAFNQYKEAKLQKRVAVKISLYMTVQLITATEGYLSFEDYRKLSSEYPDFIVDVDWIERIFLANTAEHPDFEVSTRMPSQIQQAEHLGIDYNSFCNTISQFKKKTRNEH